MNQTGGKAGLATQQAQQMRVTGMEGGHTALEFNPYAEDPRPNLFNIVKNTRENKV